MSCGQAFLGTRGWHAGCTLLVAADGLVRGNAIDPFAARGGTYTRPGEAAALGGRDRPTNSKGGRRMRGSHWQPFRQVRNRLGQLQEEVNSLFSRWAGAGDRSTAENVFPLVNVWENAEAVFVEAELPGLNLEDLE